MMIKWGNNVFLFIRCRLDVRVWVCMYEFFCFGLVIFHLLYLIERKYLNVSMIFLWFTYNVHLWRKKRFILSITHQYSLMETFKLKNGSILHCHWCKEYPFVFCVLNLLGAKCLISHWVTSYMMIPTGTAVMVNCIVPWSKL